MQNWEKYSIWFDNFCKNSNPRYYFCPALKSSKYAFQKLILVFNRSEDGSEENMCGIFRNEGVMIPTPFFHCLRYISSNWRVITRVTNFETNRVGERINSCLWVWVWQNCISTWPTEIDGGLKVSVYINHKGWLGKNLSKLDFKARKNFSCWVIFSHIVLYTPGCISVSSSCKLCK